MAEGDVLGERQQQQVEEDQRRAHQQVVHRVEGDPPRHLVQEDGDEGEQDEEQRVLERPFAPLVVVDRLVEGDPEDGHRAFRLQPPGVDGAHPQRLGVRLGEQAVPPAARPALRQVEDVPAGAEAVGRDLPLLGQIAAEEARVGPRRGEGDAALDPHRQDLERLAAEQGQGGFEAVGGARPARQGAAVRLGTAPGFGSRLRFRHRQRSRRRRRSPARRPSTGPARCPRGPSADPGRPRRARRCAIRARPRRRSARWPRPSRRRPPPAASRRGRAARRCR